MHIARTSLLASFLTSTHAFQATTAFIPILAYTNTNTTEQIRPTLSLPPPSCQSFTTAPSKMSASAVGDAPQSFLDSTPVLLSTSLPLLDPSTGLEDSLRGSKTPQSFIDEGEFGAVMYVIRRPG